jgi:tetratricopeptide (TPR) repeat protein
MTPQDVRDFVESRHFTRDIERLVKGRTGTVGGEIAYTLRAFPNHPRALKSAAELTRRSGGRMPPDFGFSIECWFDRAIAFRPDDVQVRILWAFELLQAKEKSAALQQTKAAEALAANNPAAHYNVGLLYFELGDYDKAMTNARLAYGGGFNLPGLKNKLTKAGQWKE